jgi:DNA polymerase-3 subunit alpha (Gram-positive type)
MVEEEEEETALKAYEEQYIEALKDNISRLKDLGKNTKKNKTNSDYDPQSWRDSIPFKKYTDFSLIKEDSGNVDITGEVFGIDKIRTNFFGKAVCPCGLGNGTQAINIRIVENKHTTVEEIEKLKNSMYIHIKGYAEADKRSGQVSVTARGFEIVPPPAMRSDEEEQKRVELHLHSNMSTQDGISEMSEYCSYAKKLGHTAMAITDHGCVQAFPDAQAAGKKNDIKMLYGCEFYMVDVAMSSRTHSET